MGTEVKRLLDELHRMYHGECWAGLSVKDILEDIHPELAGRTLPHFPKTIHSIALHVLATEHVVTGRLQGANKVLTAEEDWPTNITTPWNETVQNIDESYYRLYKEVEQLGDNDLDRPILKGFSSVYVTLHGHIQHNLYHYGQIALMKSLLQQPVQ